MTIKLENFSATIEIESVEITNVNDSINTKTANVDILINNQFGTTLHGFEYSSSWEDSEVLEWANNELIKYQIK